MAAPAKPGIDRIYTVAEAAEVLKVSAKHVRNLINDGEIIVIRLGEDSRTDRIEESELQRFIMRRRINRGIRGAAECPSTSAAPSGGSSSKSTVKRFDEVLKQRRKEMR